MGSNGRTTRPSQDIKEKGNQGNYQTETVITSLSRPLSFAHKSTFTLTLCSKPWVYACVSVCVRMWTRVCVCVQLQARTISHVYACVFLHVCMSASHECAMHSSLRETRHGVSAIALSFLLLSSTHPPPLPIPMMDDGEWEVSSLGLLVAVRRLAICFPLQGPVGALGFGPGFLAALAARCGYTGS